MNAHTLRWGQDALPDLPGELLLLWAVANRARLDAKYHPQRGTQHPDVSEQDQVSPRQFLAEFFGMEVEA